MDKASIYKLWKLHDDATLFEIDYNFFIKVVDILNVNKLKNPNSSNPSTSAIEDPILLKKWKIKQLSFLNECYEMISKQDFISFTFSETDVIAKSVERLAYIMNNFKLINFKANELDKYYIPKLFQHARSFLEISQLEKFVNILTARFAKIDNSKVEAEITISWDINKLDNVKMVFFHFENLCLDFKDASDWYASILNTDISSENKKKMINIMNHMLIYFLCNFYLKCLHQSYKQLAFPKFYSTVLNQILIDIKSKQFAIKSFESIALFINKLIVKYNLNKESSLIKYFLANVKICSSQSKYENIKKLILEHNE